MASISRRIAARLIDWLLVFVVWLLLGGATSERLEDGTLINPRWAVIVWIVFVIVYEAAFVAWRGQTPGKMLAAIELVALKSGDTPGLAASVVRVAPVGLAMSLLGVLFPVVMVFVYFSAAFVRDTRGLLDRLAGTVVIEARRGGGLLG